MQPPPELQLLLRLAIPRQRAVLPNLHLEVGVLRIHHSHSDDAPPPHQLPRAPAEHRQMVTVTDVVTPHDGVGRQRVRKLLPGVVPHAPVGQRLVALPRVRDVAILVRALLRHGPLRLDDDGPGKEGVNPLERALIEPNRQLAAKHLFHLELLPRLVVRLERGNHPPIDARIAQLAGDEGAHHAIHVGNALRPDVPPLHHGGHREPRENEPAGGILRQPNVGRQEKRWAPTVRRGGAEPWREDRPGTFDKDDRAEVEVDRHHRPGIGQRGELAHQPLPCQPTPRRRQLPPPVRHKPVPAATHPSSLKTGEQAQRQTPRPARTQRRSKQQHG